MSSKRDVQDTEIYHFSPFQQIMSSQSLIYQLSVEVSFKFWILFHTLEMSTMIPTINNWKRYIGMRLVSKIMQDLEFPFNQTKPPQLQDTLITTIAHKSLKLSTTCSTAKVFGPEKLRSINLMGDLYFLVLGRRWRKWGHTRAALTMKP